MMTHDITIWASPLSVLLALLQGVGTYALWRYLPDGALRRTLCSRWLAMVCLVAFGACMAVEGTWGTAVHHHPVQWAIGAVMITSLGCAVLEGVRNCREGAARNIGALASHAGLLLLAAATLWGAADSDDMHLVLRRGEAQRVAYTREGRATMLPFAVTLDAFHTDYYADGRSPRQYTASLTLDAEEATRHGETAVNHPLRHAGWWLYLSDFDHARGEWAVVKTVRDPWLWLVWCGMALLALGAVARLRLDWRSWRLMAALALTAVAFTVISVARIEFGTLMPALRSWWFVPHLACYMVAYSLLALSIVAGAAWASGWRRAAAWGAATVRMADTASSLLLLGMLCGAVWAKYAWGDWWTWDAKECWAGVTWLATLAAVHLPAGLRHRRIIYIATLLVAFAAMQIAWYGVNYLPAAQHSLHSYR